MVIKIKRMMDTFEYQHLNNVCANAMLDKFSKMKDITEWDLSGFGKWNDDDVKKQFKKLNNLGYLRYKGDVYEFWGNPIACLEVTIV